MTHLATVGNGSRPPDRRGWFANAVSDFILRVTLGGDMDTYVVRIYRRAARNVPILVGTVELAGVKQKIAFSNAEELWEILRYRKRRKERGQTELLVPGDHANSV